MKKISVITAFIFLLLSSPLSLSAANNYDGGTFYQDVPIAQDSLLGAAQYFHIFANNVYLRSHTNGNIATKNLNGSNANFGTSNYPFKEFSYLQSITSINGSSFIAGITKNKVVVGANTLIDRSNSNRPKVNDTFLDHITSDELFQDISTNYIDFTSEFNHLKQTNLSLSMITPDISVTPQNFSDFNNRVIDISAINKSVVIVSLSPDVLNFNTPLIIKGLGIGNNGKKVLLNIEVPAGDNYIVNSPIKLIYENGIERSPRESSDFSDSTILWNFVQNRQTYFGRITLTAPWQGTILSPGSTLDGTGINIDGSIIVDTFLGAGETHRWDLIRTMTVQPLNSSTESSTSGESSTEGSTSIEPRAPGSKSSNNIEPSKPNTNSSSSGELRSPSSESSSSVESSASISSKAVSSESDSESSDRVMPVAHYGESKDGTLQKNKEAQGSVDKKYPILGNKEDITLLVFGGMCLFFSISLLLINRKSRNGQL